MSPTNKRPTSGIRFLSNATRERIFSRDGYICMYCEGLAEEIDHIIPYVYSQDNSDENLVASCRDCNRMISSMHFDSFEDKKVYIIEKRSTRKWRKRIASRVSICVDCKTQYKQEANGSTYFLCAECADKEYRR